MVRVLRPDFKLVNDKNGFSLRSTESAQVDIPLPKLIAFVLSMYDGTREDNEIEEALEYILGDRVPSLLAWLLGIQREYHSFLLPVSKADVLFPNVSEWPSYNPQDFLSLKEDTDALYNRPNAPRSLGLYMTDLCNRQCLYCYANAQKGRLEDEGTISAGALKEVIDDFFRLGGRQILLTGGEALFQPISYQLIEHATSLHIYIQILTKMRLDIEKLKRADLTLLDICFSVDSHERAIANYLTGSTTFYDDILSNIRDMKVLGLPFTISMVINKMNHTHIKESIDYFIAHGAMYIETVHYVSCGANAKHDELLLDDSVRQEIDELLRLLSLQDHYSGILIHQPTTHPIILNDLRCSTGNVRLNMRYDGTYYYCDKLVHDPVLELGNSQDQTLLQIWNSPSLLHLMYPDQSLYKGTVCDTCTSYKSCTAKNSCYWVSGNTYGTIYRPIKEVDYVCSQKHSCNRI